LRVRRVAKGIGFAGADLYLQVAEANGQCFFFQQACWDADYRGLAFWSGVEGMGGRAFYEGMMLQGVSWLRALTGANSGPLPVSFGMQQASLIKSQAAWPHAVCGMAAGPGPLPCHMTTVMRY